MSYPRPYEVKLTDPKLPEDSPTEPAQPENPAQHVYEGATVFSADEQELGTVAEVRKQHFRVSQFGPDYWLAQDRIAESTKDRLQVDIDEADIESYAFDEPPVVDQMLSEEERHHQREQMEEELAEQREEREGERQSR